MLDFDDRKNAIAELIGSFPCRVELPDQWRDNFEKRGPVMNDRPGTQRVHCRSHRNRAGLQYQSTFHAFPRQSAWHNVYLTIVAQDGLSFLHSEPVYPREQMRMLLLSGRQLEIEIVNCKRVGAQCFEIEAHVPQMSKTTATPSSSTAAAATVANGPAAASTAST